LLEDLARRASAAAPAKGELLPWKERHVELLQAAAGHLDRAVAAGDAPIELRCEDLRASADELGRIAGNVDVEDLLDVIFSQFCIGK
jgi:tRNA modification GTPase